MPQITTSHYEPIFMEKLLGKNYKWWYFFVFRFKSATTYRMGTFLWFLGSLLELSGLIFVWWLNKQSGSQINFSQVFTYLVVGRIINGLTDIDEVFWFGSQLAQNRGDSTKLLMLPNNFNGMLTYLLVKYLGSSVTYFLFNTFWLVIFVLIFSQWLILPTSWLFLFWLPFFVIITLLIRFLLNFCIGMLALWTVDAGGIWNLFGSVSRVLTGSAFPLNLHPLTNFALYLPFAYIYFYPMNLYFQNETPIISLIYGIFWCVVLYFLAKLAFKMGLKKNESVGL